MHTQHAQELKECFTNYADSLYRFCLFRLHGDEMVASDLVQESFYRAGVELAKWREIQNLKSFIFRIAMNLIIDLSRKVKVDALDESEDAYPETVFSPEKQAFAQIELERMYEVLDRIDPDDRNLFLLRYTEEIAPKEIASMLGLNINALTVRLHRLKNTIAEFLNPTL